MPTLERLWADERRRDLLLCGGFLLLGALTCFYGIGAKSFWRDEAISWYRAQVDWSGFTSRTIRVEGVMSLYYFLLHFWTELGTNDAWIRSFSAIVGALSVPIMYLLGKDLRGPATGALAAGLLALNSFFVRYAQEARSYALATFLVILATFMLVRYVIHRRRAYLIGYVIASTVAIFAHVFAIWVIGAHVVSLLLLKERGLTRRQMVLATAGGAVIALPLLIWQALPKIMDPEVHGLSWMRPIDPYQVLYAFRSFTGAQIRWILYFALLVFSCWLAIATFIKQRGSFETWSRTMPLLWFVIPFGGTILFSLFAPIFAERYLIVCVPGLVLSVAIAIASMKPKWLMGVAIVVVVATACIDLRYWYVQPSYQGWESAANYVMSNMEPGDGVIAQGQATIVPFYFYGRDRWTEKDPNILYPYTFIPSSKPSYPVDELAAQLKDPDGALPKRIWLVVGQSAVSEDNPSIRAALEDAFNVRYTRIHTELFPGVEVVLREVL
jgi:mannosyltransferase